MKHPGMVEIDGAVRKIPLLRKILERVDDHAGASGQGDLPRVVSRARVEDDKIVAAAERTQAGRQFGLFVERQDEDGEHSSEARFQTG